MKTSERSLICIYNSIDEWNSRQKEAKFKLSKSLDTEIFGENSILDSLGIIHFLASIEENIKDIFKKDLILASEKSLDLEESPFKNVESLNNYICSLIDNN